MKVTVKGDKGHWSDWVELDSQNDDFERGENNLIVTKNCGNDVGEKVSEHDANKFKQKYPIINV